MLGHKLRGWCPLISSHEAHEELHEKRSQERSCNALQLSNQLTNWNIKLFTPETQINCPDRVSLSRNFTLHSTILTSDVECQSLGHKLICDKSPMWFCKKKLVLKNVRDSDLLGNSVNEGTFINVFQHKRGRPFGGCHWGFPTQRHSSVTSPKHQIESDTMVVFLMSGSGSFNFCYAFVHGGSSSHAVDRKRLVKWLFLV